MGSVTRPIRCQVVSCPMPGYEPASTVVQLLGHRAPHVDTQDPIPMWVELYVCETCLRRLQSARDSGELRITTKPVPAELTRW